MYEKTMKAVGLYRYLPIENEESLMDIEIEKPSPNGRDLLVEVKAVSVNPVDTKVRSPRDRVEQSAKILGWDVSGIVEQVGPDCTLFRPGDEVYYAGSITRQGGNSQFHLVDERITGRKPKNLDFAQAAAIPLTGITAWEALFDRLGISMQPEKNHGKIILIIGAAGGVGSIASQLANLVGLTVIGTASRQSSIEWSRYHGCDYCINHYQSFVPQLNEIGVSSVDFILCLNALDLHWNKMAEAVKPQGKICSIVSNEKPVDLNLLKTKSITFVWEYMYTRSMYGTEDMVEQHHLLNSLAELMESGKIKTTLTERLEPINAKNLRLAHSKVEEGSMIGKIVIEKFPQH